MTELDAVLTPVSLVDAFAGFRAELVALRGVTSDDELALAVAHSALETGYWRSAYCYDFGNEKATDAWIEAGGDHCFYPCGEEFSQVYARSLVASSPLITIVREYVDGRGVAMASVKVVPKHPICRFRAFKSLADGVRKHLEELRNDFPRAWASLATGNVVTFATDLRAEGYFTDPLEHYLHGKDGHGGLAAVLAEVRPKVPEAAAGEVVGPAAAPDEGITGAAARGETPPAPEE